MNDPLTLYFDQYCECENPIAELVLLHGWGMNSLIWDLVIPALQKQFKVTLIDLPGMGRSPIPEGQYDLNYLAEKTLAVAPKEAIWIGWSLGGLVASQVALIAPDRVQGCINIASPPRFLESQSPEDPWKGITASALKTFSEWLHEDWQGSLIRFLALQCKSSASQKQDIRFLQERVFHHGLPAPQALRCGLDIIGQGDLRKEMAHIKKPIFSILGARDEVVPIAMADQLSALYGENIFIIEEASHIPMLSHPMDCVSIIRQCIERVLNDVSVLA